MVEADGERRFSVDDSFRMPDFGGRLGRLVSLAPLALRATYYDTDDFRLARAGIALRFQRSGEASLERHALPWSVIVSGVRVDRPGKATSVPADLAALLTVYTRGATLAPSAVVRTSRVGYEFRDTKDRLLATVTDDRISVLDERRVRLKFREITTSRGRATEPAMARLVGSLRAAGASGRGVLPTNVRAIGPAAEGAPDLAPPARVRDGAALAEALTTIIRTDVGRLFFCEPLVRIEQSRAGAVAHRLDTEHPAGGPHQTDHVVRRSTDMIHRIGGMLRQPGEAVHQMRVAVRRLRADLKSFDDALDRKWVNGMRDELRWLGTMLGAVRDADVLRARLRHTAGLDPSAPLDEAAIARIDADLAARHEDAMRALDDTLACGRYLALVNELLVAANDPPVSRRAHRAASTAVPRMVARAYAQLAVGNRQTPGARELTADDPDAIWHEVRKRGKNARYAAEAAATIDSRAPRLAHALADVADVLGAHQDAVMAAETWLAVATADPDDHALAITAGRLFERERAQAHGARRHYPEVWAAVDRARLTKWLR